MALTSLMSFCSGPFWPDGGVREQGAEELLRYAAGALADTSEGALVRDHPPLGTALREIGESEAFARPAWTPVLGVALSAALDGRPSSVLSAAASLVLDFVESVKPFSCRLDLDVPTRVKADPLLLGPTPWLAIDWRGSELVLETSWATATLAVSATGRNVIDLNTGNDEAAGCLEEVADLGGIAVVRDVYGGCFPPMVASSASSHVSVLLDEVASARDCLRLAAPGYLAWISAMVRYLVPVAPPDGEFASGSALQAPGAVALSPGSGGIRVAESLVHEGSHQYFFFASRFARLVREGCDEQYYSPFVRRKRPLDRILLAFHAAANVVAFYSLLQESAWQLEHRRDVEHAIADCRVLARHLDGNPHLTEAGAGLHWPIADWLARRGLM